MNYQKQISKRRKKGVGQGNKRKLAHTSHMTTNSLNRTQRCVLTAPNLQNNCKQPWRFFSAKNHRMSHGFPSKCRQTSRDDRKVIHNIPRAKRAPNTHKETFLFFVPPAILPGKPEDTVKFTPLQQEARRTLRPLI